jgi:hypothetical protein
MSINPTTKPRPAVSGQTNNKENAVYKITVNIDENCQDWINDQHEDINTALAEAEKQFADAKEQCKKSAEVIVDDVADADPDDFSTIRRFFADWENGELKEYN